MPDMLVHGSCVSRDTKAHFPDGWEVPVYVARQSMISSASGPAPVEGESRLESAFQNRMIQWDIQGNGFDLILEALPSADLLLIDLVDERRGIWEVEPGKFVTNSFEMQQSGLMTQQLSPPRFIPFGDDEHFELWAPAADRFVSAIRQTSTPTFVFAPKWALTSNSGKQLQVLQRPVQEFNDLYIHYHDHLAALGLPMVLPPDDLVVADDNHVWGLEAFHFVKPFYHHMRDRVLAELGGATSGA